LDGRLLFRTSMMGLTPHHIQHNRGQWYKLQKCHKTLAIQNPIARMCRPLQANSSL
jgi:hypothetical protein